MAINKVTPNPGKTHKSLKKAISYVVDVLKTEGNYIIVGGPYDGKTINVDDIYRNWLEEKKRFGKDSGRMFAHFVLAFHKDEDITPEQVLEIAELEAEEFFSDYQYVIDIHQDKEHLHAHTLVNTVSFLDGLKLHWKKYDLQKLKDFNNKICAERGLTIAEKGCHFDGTPINEYEVISYDRKTYEVLTDKNKPSILRELADIIREAKARSNNWEEYSKNVEEKGWCIEWRPNRKKSTLYTNKNGKKITNSCIEKNFPALAADKEAIEDELRRQNEARIIREREYLREYQLQSGKCLNEVSNAATVRAYTESAIRASATVRNDAESAIRASEAIRNDRATGSGNQTADIGNIGSERKEIHLRGAVENDRVKAGGTTGEWQTRGQGDDTDLFITNIKTEINKKRDALIKAAADLDNEKTRRANSKPNEKSIIDNKAASKPGPNGKKKYSSYEKLKDMKRKSDQSDEYQDSGLSL